MVTPSGAGGINLPSSAFDEVFPFHFAFGPDWSILRRGRSLARVCPLVVPGAKFDRLFEPVRPEVPFAFEAMAEARRTLFLVKEVSTGVVLRGQMLSLRPAQEAIVFLGSPWLPEVAAITQHGLSFDDFAVHDPALDLLHVLQSQKMAVADLRKLAQKLQSQRATLRETNQKLQHQEAEHRKLALIAARTDNGVVLTDREGKAVWVNEGFTRLTGYTLTEIMGRTPGSVLQGPGTDPETVRYMGARIRQGEGFRVEILNYAKDGRSYWVAVEVQPFVDEQGRLTNFMALQRNITGERAAQQRVAIQLEVSKVLADADDGGTAFSRVLRTVCEILGWQTGQVWQVVNERLRLFESWHRASAQVTSFVAASRGMEFAQGVGLPGRVWATAQPAWIADVAHDPSFPRADVASKDNLHGAFAFPVLVRGRVWGVVEFFSHDIEEPDEALLKTFSSVGNQIGQFIARQRAELALREAHALQQAILEGANYSIISTAPDGRIVTFNRAAERMLGYRTEEVVGRLTPLALHDPEDIAKRARELTRELGREVGAGFEVLVAKASRGEPDEREWTYVRKDGSRLPVMLSVTALQNEQGQVTGYLGIGSDVTQRKAAEQNLRESESRQRAITDSAQDAILMIDPNGRVSHWNPAAERMLGYTRAEAMGQDLHALIAPARYHAAQRAAFAVFVRTGQGPIVGKTRDVEARRKDGCEISVQLSLSAIQLEGQWHSVGILRDVTQAKRTEVELQRQSRLQQLLMEISSTYISLPLGAVETAVQGSLRDLALFVGADRAYIFDYDFGRQVCRNTHEWCGEGIAPQIHDLQGVSIDAMPDWVEAHRQAEAVYVPDVLSLPPGRLREVLEPQGIKSLLAVPMMNQDVCIGFVGFDSVRQHHSYSDSERRLLTVFAQMLVNVRMRKQAEEQLRSTLSELERLNRVMMNREQRVLELKHDINQLRLAAGQPAAYPSAMDSPAHLTLPS